MGLCQFSAIYLESLCAWEYAYFQAARRKTQYCDGIYRARQNNGITVRDFGGKFAIISNPDCSYALFSAMLTGMHLYANYIMWDVYWYWNVPMWNVPKVLKCAMCILHEMQCYYYVWYGIYFYGMGCAILCGMLIVWDVKCYVGWDGMCNIIIMWDGIGCAILLCGMLRV